MKRMAVLLLVVLLLGGCSGGTLDHNVLFIGNSYTHSNDMPDTVRKIARENGVNIEVTMIAPGGRWLDEHLSDPKVLVELGSGTYDTVIFQEQSVAPSFAPTANDRTKPAAAALYDRAVAGGARVVWFQTWGHLNGFAELGHTSYGTMQTAIIETYSDIQARSGGTIAPVGERWQRVLTSGQNVVLYTPDGSHPSPLVAI